MITRENLQEVINQIDEVDYKRMVRLNLPYVVIQLHTFNVGSVVTIKCTSYPERFESQIALGNAILPIEEVMDLKKLN